MSSARSKPAYGVIKDLQKQSTGDFGVDAAGQTVTKAPPGYGVFGQGLSGALQTAAQNPFYGGASMAALADYTDRERLNTASATQADRDQALTVSILTHPELFKDARALEHLDTSALGASGKIFNPVPIAADAAIDRQKEISTAHKEVFAGLKDARDAGVTVADPNQLGDLANPITGEAPTGYGLFTGNRTPGEVAAQTTADANMIKAEADRTDANNPLKYNRKSGGSGGGDGTTTSIVVPVPGVGMVTVKGKNGQGVVDAARGYQNGPTGTSPLLADRLKAADRLGYNHTPQADGSYIIHGKNKSWHLNADGTTN